MFFGPTALTRRACTAQWQRRHNNDPKKDSTMAEQVRAFAALSIPDIQQLARQQAEHYQPLAHGYVPGSTQAIAWERAYTARKIELDTPESV